MSEDILQTHKAVWEKKPVLRKLYSNWYEEMSHHFKTGGPCLEIGGGTGNFKENYPNIICTDIVKLPWLDIVASAEDLPFKNGSFSNIILFDVLHHIENPSLFFTEALRVLEKRGKLIIMDPYISPASWPVYNYLHPEPVDFKQDPLKMVLRTKDRKPFDANQAVATLLFQNKKSQFSKHFPQFTLLYKKRFSYIVYPLSGGFSHPSLIPNKMISPLLSFEHFLQPLAMLLAFRILVVLQKDPLTP